MGRIELHAKTNMSFMDGIADCRHLVRTAFAMGLTAIAVCDGSTVLAYPRIAGEMRELERESGEAGEKFDFKLLYGVEVYVRDDREGIGEPEYPGYFDYSVVLLLKSWQQNNAIYQLLSEAADVSDNEHPVILKSELEKHRDDILVGAADDMGELWMALAFGEDDETVAGKMAFYDYVEIMPAAYLQHWITDELGMCRSLEDIQHRQKQLLALAKRLGKPVIATNHPTLLAPVDLMARQRLVQEYHTGKADADYPLFLLRSEDMKRQLDYLDADSVQAVVEENPQMIVDICGNGQMPNREWHYPRCDKLPHDAVLEHELKERIEAAARERYDAVLAESIRHRIQEEWQLFKNQELESIFAALVKLCDYSREKGYPVQVRGSLGNLVMAYLTDMVPDDPLPYGLTLEGYFGIQKDRSGYFELNFAEDIYEEIQEQLAACFPHGQLVRVSMVKMITVGERPVPVMAAWDRHPEKVMIIPDKRQLYEYMPLRQHVDRDGRLCSGLYTGFDFRDLGNVYFTFNLGSSRWLSMIGRLQALISVAWRDIPIRDAELLRQACNGNSRGIAGLYAPCMRQLIDQLKPHSFDELLKVFAMQHGTDVWEENQKQYFEQHDITFATLIAAREDVLDFCMGLGMELNQAFPIMENVRKGKGLRKVQLRLLRNYAAPEWFISCCSGDNHIAFLFPRAHCLNSLRWSLIALWYKLRYPQEFGQVHFENDAGNDSEGI